MDDEVRVIANLLIGFVRRVEFGRDFEQQLSFYVEARASFSNIDAVVVFLVQVAIICSRDVTSQLCVCWDDVFIGSIRAVSLTRSLRRAPQQTQ